MARGDHWTLQESTEAEQIPRLRGQDPWKRYPAVIPSSTVLRITVHCSVLRCSTRIVQYSTLQGITVQCSTVQYSTSHYIKLQYLTGQYSALLYCTVHCCTGTVQYSPSPSYVPHSVPCDLWAAAAQCQSHDCTVYTVHCTLYTEQRTM